MPINSFIYPSQVKLLDYEVANSCRLNRGDSPYMSKTHGSAGNQRTFTVSFWYKRTNFGEKEVIMSTTDGGSSFFSIGFTGSGTYVDKFFIYWYDGSSPATDYGYFSTRLFRDVSAWYHVVLAVDTTQGTESDRVKLYINGTLESLTAVYAAFPENHDTYFNKDNVHYIAYDHDSASAALNGYLAELVIIDGTQYAASDFGEFDEDSPTIWKPIDVSGLTFGTNGAYLDFEDSSNLGNDANGGTDWTESNLAATDQTTDTPTNNFCTLNPLASGVAIGGSAGTFTEGNTRFAAASAAWCASKSTFSVSNGKWYYEAKKNSDSAGDTVGAGYTGVGYAELQSDLPATNPTNGSGVYSSILYLGDNGWTTNFADGTQWGTPQAVDDGDIIGIALNLDDDEYTFYVNGSSVNNGSLGAGYDGNGLTPCIIDHQHARNFYLNFGNPSYANSSDAADENGYGAFEYAPPSGYYALCTKNLAEYG